MVCSLDLPQVARRFSLGQQVCLSKIALKLRATDCSYLSKIALKSRVRDRAEFGPCVAHKNREICRHFVFQDRAHPLYPYLAVSCAPNERLGASLFVPLLRNHDDLSNAPQPRAKFSKPQCEISDFQDFFVASVI